MDTKAINQAADHLGVAITGVRPLKGGDISCAYVLETGSALYVCKLAAGPSALDMFQAEKMGLEAIAQTKTLRVPQLFFCGELGDGAGLVMEYISSKTPTGADYERFGHQLGLLHKTSYPAFGWSTENYIGSLKQANKENAHWPVFYLEQRLLPQLNLSCRLGALSENEIPDRNQMFNALRDLLPETTPVLIHGDLWSGNFLIAMDGTPVLIDPASYAGHHEVDLAMTRLFGGFDSHFYGAYEEILPGESGSGERTGLYQLYYLLVHLNLFGRSYHSRVKSLLTRYF